MPSQDSLPIVAGTLQTDPRSGGLKRSSGVNVLPIVAEIWAQVRNDADPTVDWLIAGYEDGSKTDITVFSMGGGGLNECSQHLQGDDVYFGGCRLASTGRFVTFYYASENAPTMKRGRGSMHKNGVLNILEGSDGEIKVTPGLTEEEVILPGGGTISTQPRTGGAPAPTTPSVKHLTPKNSNDMNNGASNNQHVYKKQTAPSFAQTRLKHVSTKTSPVKQVPVIETAESKNGTDESDPAALPENCFSYEELKEGIPDGVDATKKEEYLTDADFESIFEMSRSEFRALAGWKRTNLKKKKGLF